VCADVAPAAKRQVREDARVSFFDTAYEDPPPWDLGRPQRAIEELAEAGQFPAGGMLPKVEAVVSFVRGTGKQAIICSAESLLQALDGAAGTLIVPDAAT